MDPIVVTFFVAAITGLGAFVGKIVLDFIAYLKAQVVSANARTDKAIEAGHETAAAVEALTAVLHRQKP